MHKLIKSFLIVLLASSCQNDKSHSCRPCCGTEAYNTDTRAAIATARYELSDKRLKRNVQQLSHSLLKLKFVKPITYQWNSVKAYDTTSVQTGFIAQDLEVLYPDLVMTGPDGFKSVNYIGLVPHLVQAIKELKIENEQLRVENSQLKKNTAKRDKRLDERMHALEVTVQQMSAQAYKK